MLSLPKRLRYFLKTNPAAVSGVLHILLRVIHQELIERCPNTPKNARLGAVSFIHRFGDALNEHIHFDENRPGSHASRALQAPKSAPGGLVIAASSMRCSTSWTGSFAPASCPP